MPPRTPSLPDTETLEQLAGLTGIGWTAAILGYLGAVFGYGSALVARLAVDPQSLLYLGGALLVTTLGLDRLQTKLTEREGAHEADGPTAD